MPYPLLLPSDLEVIETISSQLPEPKTACDFISLVRNLSATRRSKNIPRQALSMKTPVDPIVLRNIDSPEFNNVLKEIASLGFPNLSQRLYNEWITNLVLLTPTPLRQEQGKASFLKNLIQGKNLMQQDKTDPQIIERNCLPGDIETAESLLPSLTASKQATVKTWLLQLRQLITERRQHGSPRPSATDEELISLCTNNRSALRNALSPLVELGFPKMTERLITEYLLEVKALSQVALKTTSLDSSYIAENMASRYQTIKR